MALEFLIVRRWLNPFFTYFVSLGYFFDCFFNFEVFCVLRLKVIFFEICSIIFGFCGVFEVFDVL